MMIGIWKYKPQEKSKNVDKAWSSIFLAKIALFVLDQSCLGGFT